MFNLQYFYKTNMRPAFMLLCISLVAGWLLSASPALASGTVSECDGSGSNCDVCLSSSIYANVDSGNQIILAMFTAINNVLSQVQQTFFNGFVGSNTFQTAMGAAILLYVGLYGIMISLNLSAYHTGEVAERLIKVGIVYMMTAPGAWTAFNHWIATPAVGSMNQLIKEFTVLAEGGSSAAASISVPDSSGGNPFDISVSGSAGLDVSAISAMFGSSITTVFSIKMMGAIIASIKAGYHGWFVAILLILAIKDFAFMLLGALVTYARSIIGLAFLFGIAPLFFVFLLFDRTRQIFISWVQMIIAFAMQPVMLFAFLSFYIALINYAVPHLLTDGNYVPVDFCWYRWFSMAGTLWDIAFLSPTYSGSNTVSWTTASGDTLREYLGVPNLLYFLMVCYLGRTFSNSIGTLSDELMGRGIGAVSAAELSQAFNSAKSNFMKFIRE